MGSINSPLKIGMTGHFEDEIAEITGKVVLVDEFGLEWNHWYLEAKESDSFWIREYTDEGEDGEDELLYEILSIVEEGDIQDEEDINFGVDFKDGDEKLAYKIFADWKNFKNLSMINKLKVESIEGNQPEKKFAKGEYIKVMDVSFADDEEEEAVLLEEDEMIVDTSIMWSEENTWVFGMEYLEENDIKKIFAL